MTEYNHEFTITCPVFTSIHNTSWQVFERMKNGEMKVIALCTDRKQAKKIVDALNATS